MAGLWAKILGHGAEAAVTPPPLRDAARAPDDLDLRSTTETPSGGIARSFLYDNQRVVVDIADETDGFSVVDWDFVRNIRGGWAYSYTPVVRPPRNPRGLMETTFGAVANDAVERGRPAYIFKGASDAHTAIYRRLMAQSPAPEGYRWVSQVVDREWLFEGEAKTQTIFGLVRDDITDEQFTARARAPLSALNDPGRLGAASLRALRLGSGVAVAGGVGTLAALGGVDQGEAEASDFIRNQEGVRLDAYQDQGGTWTIGYGHTTGVEQGQSITEAEAEAFLEQDLATARAAVYDAVRVRLAPNEEEALVSLAFNIGAGAFAESSLVERLNAGDRAGAAEEFLRWSKVGDVENAGLAARRSRERELFLGAATPETEPAPPSRSLWRAAIADEGQGAASSPTPPRRRARITAALGQPQPWTAQPERRLSLAAAGRMRAEGMTLDPADEPLPLVDTAVDFFSRQYADNATHRAYAYGFDQQNEAIKALTGEDAPDPYVQNLPVMGPTAMNIAQIIAMAVPMPFPKDGMAERGSGAQVLQQNIDARIAERQAWLAERGLAERFTTEDAWERGAARILESEEAFAEVYAAHAQAGGSPATRFAAAAAGGLIASAQDPLQVGGMAVPVGGGGRSLWIAAARAALANAAISTGTEALLQPGAQDLRERVGLPRESIRQALIFAAAGGAVFGGGLEVLGRVLGGAVGRLAPEERELALDDVAVELEARAAQEPDAQAQLDIIDTVRRSDAAAAAGDPDGAQTAMLDALRAAERAGRLDPTTQAVLAALEMDAAGKPDGMSYPSFYRELEQAAAEPAPPPLSAKELGSPTPRERPGGAELLDDLDTEIDFYQQRLDARIAAQTEARNRLGSPERMARARERFAVSREASPAPSRAEPTAQARIREDLAAARYELQQINVGIAQGRKLTAEVRRQQIEIRDRIGQLEGEASRAGLRPDDIEAAPRAFADDGRARAPEASEPSARERAEMALRSLDEQTADDADLRLAEGDEFFGDPSEVFSPPSPLFDDAGKVTGFSWRADSPLSPEAKAAYEAAARPLLEERVAALGAEPQAARPRSVFDYESPENPVPERAPDELTEDDLLTPVVTGVDDKGREISELRPIAEALEDNDAEMDVVKHMRECVLGEVVEEAVDAVV